MTLLLWLVAIPLALWALVWVFAGACYVFVKAFSGLVEFLIRQGVIIPPEEPSRGPRA